jgi:hypothetical protein
LLVADEIGAALASSPLNSPARARRRGETGRFTIRFAKTGYATAERTYDLPGDRFNSLDVTLTPSAHQLRP